MRANPNTCIGSPPRRTRPTPKLLADIKKLEREARTRIDELRRVRELASAETLAAVATASANDNPFTNPVPLSTNPDKDYPEPAPRTGPAPAAGSFEDIREKQAAFFRITLKLDALKEKLGRDTAHTTAIAMAELPEPKDINIRIRGEADNLGPVVSRGFLQAVSVKDAPKIPANESGRRQLADWLTRPDHPLTARVIVNRLWAKLFGVGIVPTVDDFGDQGQKASNPELLDYLAVRFVEQGWSVKQALRELVLSRTYQLSAADDARGIAKDEANVLLWRWNRKRLDGEALRDAVLSASGRLDPARPTGSPIIELGLRELGPLADYSPVQKPSRYRSVYLPVLRNKLPEALVTFDMPDPSLVVGQRETTTSPTQALYLLNSPFILEQAEQLSRRLLAAQDLDDASRVERAYVLVLSRRPSPAELERVQRFLAAAKGGADAETRRQAAWERFAQTLLALPEFRYLF